MDVPGWGPGGGVKIIVPVTKLKAVTHEPSLRLVEMAINTCL